MPDKKTSFTDQEFVGMHFNYLTVVEKTSEKVGTNYLWKCKCDCGNETMAIKSAIVSGHKKSCGCLHTQQRRKLGQSKKKDLTGKRFGQLLAIKETDERKDGRVVWICQCDCGNQVKYSSHDLLSGGATHCPKCQKHISLGEEKIKKLLEENNISYEVEKVFDTCKGDNGKNYRFDFYVDNKYLIEYDGKQHFIKDSGFGKDLKNIQKRDSEKTQWCIANNIPLIRIPYTLYEELQINDLLLSNIKYLVQGEK